jgi:hypothetical protein
MSGEITPASESAQQPAQGGQHAGSQEVSAISAPPWMQHFLDNQTKELDLRVLQSKLDELKEQHAFDYSTKALEAQSTYLAQEHVHGSSRFRGLCWLSVGLTFLVLLFLAIVILSGNGQIALELMKVVIYGGLGALGGYGYARSRKPEVPPGSNPES